ncbi:DUF6624 domain-containing protein [Caulobacter segnis]
MKLLLSAVFSLSASAAFAQSPPPGVTVLSVTCGSSERMEEAAKAQLTKSSTPDIDLAAASKAIAAGRAQHAKALGGEPVDEAFKSASRFGALAKTTQDAEVADLFRRAARDQLYRNTFTAAMQKTSWAAGLSDASRAYAYQFLAGEGCNVDDDNRSWLRARVASRGWFKISTSGADADRAAFLLVQHADREPAFQGEMLALLESLVAAGETKPSNFALLSDRVFVAQKRPQRYGTQGRCLVTGWAPFDIEDSDGLDKRRLAVGLPPEAEYVALNSKRCVAS